jgi:hypothetical protein
VLKKLKAKLQSLKTECEEARHSKEMALKGKAAVRWPATVCGCRRTPFSGSRGRT